MKKISIIIPCFNCSEWVRHGWNSLKKQTIGIDEIECIFVNDASTDSGKTQHVLEEVEKEAPDSVMVITLDTNMRQGGARNVGMQYMSGEYMLLMDADDLYRPETCEELYETAKKYNADIVRFMHDMVVGDFSSESIPTRKRDGSIQVYDLGKDDTRRLFLTGEMEQFGCTNKLYKTELIRQVKSTFAEHLVYEEPKFVYPLFLYAGRVVITKEKYYIWRVRVESTMTSELGKKLMEHPMVQMQLYEALTEYDDILIKYREEVQFHFFFSYYFETLCFTVINKAELPLPFYRMMQEVCRKVCPDILNNKYLAKFSYLRPVAESIDEPVYSQYDLNYRALRLAFDARQDEVKRRIPEAENMVEGVNYIEADGQPLISIILAVDENVQGLMHTVMSVFRQRFESWELLLVLGKKDDELLEVLKRIESLDRRVKVIEGDANCRSAVDAGIKNACGKYVTILDYTDLFSEGMLAVASHYLVDEDVDIMLVPRGGITCDAKNNVLQDNIQQIEKSLPDHFILRDADITEKMNIVLSSGHFNDSHNIYRSGIVKDFICGNKIDIKALIAKHEQRYIMTIGYDKRCLYYDLNVIS